MSLDEILIKKRKNLNYSQKHAAELLDVSQSTYCDWESGATKPNADNLLKISKFYDIDINELLESTPNFNIVNSPNSVNNSLNNSPNAKIETSEILLKVADSLDKLIAVMEKMTINK